VEDSISQKMTWLRKVLSPWSDRIKEMTYLPWEEQLHYRDKVSLAAVYDDGRWQFGMKRKGKVIPIPDCPLHSRNIHETISILSHYLPGPDILDLAMYVQSGAQLILVVRTAVPKGVRWSARFFRELMDAGNEGIWLHINPLADEKVFARETWQFLFGKQRSMNSLKLMYGPMSYQQIIPRFYKQALRETIDFFDFQNGDGVADLYCGTGGSLVAFTHAGALGIGIDINGEAVECARMNVTGTLVLRGKCMERMDQVEDWISYKEIKRFFVYANPPRTGMEPEVLQWIIGRGRPLRIAYMSCNAATLRTEIEVMVNSGYEVRSILPFDTFPRTHHIECVAMLEDQKAKVNTVSSPGRDLT
jgi:tRNA/tmRNA/rRNA uracil-C5-methylase (TrmA/RlmC/RlmD family)